jgi:hypothetical protein
MTPEHESRLLIYIGDIAQSIKILAGAMASISGTMAMTYQQTFPIKNPPRDIEITHPPTDEEKLRREQGATGEATLKDWMDLNERIPEEEIGLFEQAFNESEKRRTDARGKGEGGVDGPGRGPEKTGA